MSDNPVSYPTEHSSKFTLLEMLIILLLVGLVFVFIVPVNRSRLNEQRVYQALESMKVLGEQAEIFKNNPANGYYPFDLSQMNLKTIPDTTYFSYSINDKDSTLVAKTTKRFGGKPAYLVYSLSAKQFQVGKDDSDTDSKRVINENWLP